MSDLLGILNYHPFIPALANAMGPSASKPASATHSQSGTVTRSLPTAPDLLLLYCDYDAKGPRNWSLEHLKYYLAYHENRGTAAEKPIDVFFDLVLWMYQRSSRGRFFEPTLTSQPTMELDWRECLDRFFAPGLQLNAIEQTLAKLETSLQRPMRAWVVLTIPYPDVRVTNWSESPDGPAWNFKRTDIDRLSAVQWFVQSALNRWRDARFKHLDLLGFYWFTEWHINVRSADEITIVAPQTDISLIQSVARYVHSLDMDGRKLTLSWIPYNAYADEHRDVVTSLLKADPAERIDYLMIQPNYFFPHCRKQKSDLVNIVRSAAARKCGVEVECNETLIKDPMARQRFQDYLDTIRTEHPEWKKYPVGYYQSFRTFYDMALSAELASLYDELYRFVCEHRNEQASPGRPSTLPAHLGYLTKRVGPASCRSK